MDYNIGNYLVKHIGDGRFEIETDEGIKEAGPNLCGMIRYTYFEDYTLPPLGWSISRLELLKDYQPKVLKDIIEGKIKPGKHEFGETDWINTEINE